MKHEISRSCWMATAAFFGWLHGCGASAENDVPTDEIGDELAGVYQMQAVHSSKCVGTTGTGTANGAAVHQFTCDPRPTERWQTQSLGNGNYKLVSAVSGQCLVVASASHADGAAITQWPCKDANNHKWKLTAETGGAYELRSLESGKCLDVAGASLSDDAKVQQWTCNGHNNQRVRFMGSASGPDAGVSNDAAVDAHDGAPSASDADSGMAAPRGATLPYLEYEAEDGTTNGTVLGPSRAFGEIPAESSGRRAVRLDTTGHYVAFVAKASFNSIVLRYVVPDTSDGKGASSTLSLYVNGAFRQKVSLTSKYAWTYGAYPGTNNPADGRPHHFYDEARALVGEIPAGATMKLQKDATDTAAYYVVDLVDLEEVPPPLAMPAGYLSITTCGAVANDATDDGPAIQQCIDTARQRGQGVFIPPGIFRSTTRAWNTHDVTIRGAGMWYSTLSGTFARFNCAGNNCKYYDFAILGETVVRNDQAIESGFTGPAGTGSRLENIWVEHTKAGYWVGPGTTDGLVIHGCRFRDTYADGVNFHNGTVNSIVEETQARNTGDNALACSCPVSQGAITANNVFRFDTVQLPWVADCYGLFGGTGNRIEDDVCVDSIEHPGVLLGRLFGSHPFAGTTVVQRTTLLRAGGPVYGDKQGALKLEAAQASMTGILLKDIDIDSATFAGIELKGPNRIDGTTLDDIHVTGAGTWGVQVDSDVSGSASATGVVVSGTASGGLTNGSASFAFARGAGNVGW